MRKLRLKLRYRPRRVECPRGGVRVEDFPWAEPWARVTTALFNAVAVLARELSWKGTAREYGLNWKSVATIVKRTVQYGLKHRRRPPVHWIGIDEVSRRKGQVYLTVVYDLERRVLRWVGDDRTEEAVRPFFTHEMGKRRCQTLRVVCMDMWAPYANLVREHAVNAQLLFDRFHIVKHLNEAVDAGRRELWRQLTSKERVTFQGTRWLLLKNPWNLNPSQKERLSTLVRWNSPLVRASTRAGWRCSPITRDPTRAVSCHPPASRHSRGQSATGGFPPGRSAVDAAGHPAARLRGVASKASCPAIVFTASENEAGPIDPFVLRNSDGVPNTEAMNSAGDPNAVTIETQKLAVSGVQASPHSCLRSRVCGLAD